MNRAQSLFRLFGLMSAALLIGAAEARLPSEGMIGGDRAKDGDYPYQVSVQLGGSSVCGGSILAERFVISAAHCVTDSEGEFFGVPMTVVAGVADLRSRSQHRVVVDVQQVFVPKEYDPTRGSNPIADIAVLKLKRDLGISTNRNLGKVELPGKDESFADVQATVSGFGWNWIGIVNDPVLGTQETGGWSFNKLRYAKAKVFTNDACQIAYPDSISPKHICAALVQRSFEAGGVCSGDSGGPLVYDGVLIGVVNRSPTGCREDNYPAVHTRVSEYTDFVKAVVSGRITSDIRSYTLERF